jgi:hypothetical protein
MVLLAGATSVAVCAGLVALLGRAMKPNAPPPPDADHAAAILSGEPE